MKQGKLRVAIIGCGRISSRYHDAFQRLQDQIDVVAAVDCCFERAEAFAASFPGAKAYRDYETLFSLDLDVVHLALPHYLHAPVGLDFLARGINVLCEKPLALTGEEADEMIAMAKAKHCLLGCIFQTRYNESVQILKKMKEEGAFGKILAVRSLLTWNRSQAYYDQSPWKGTWAKEGGGVLIDQAIHSLDRVRYLLGEEPVSCVASLHNYAHPHLEVEDTVEGSIRFPSGALYSFYATDCYGANSPINIEFIGEKGRFGLNQDIGYSSIDGIEKEYRHITPEDSVNTGYWGTRHVMELADFYAAVRTGRSFLIDGEEGKKTLMLIKGLYLSGLTHQRVDFPFQDLRISDHPELYATIKR
jgi:UDP-N-acetyl-2-amino-2-deoxyglucuronate dehydrogenase